MTKEKFKIYEGVFDNFTIETIKRLITSHYIDKLGEIIAVGKEADVYIAYKENKPLALKIYRINNSNFNKMKDYFKRDPRFKGTVRSKRKLILKWVEKEFRNLLRAHKGGINVPTPIIQKNNLILMEYIKGFRLKDIDIEDPENMFKTIINEIEALKEVGLIHGDMSEFNILVEDHIPYIIDFGQAVYCRNEEDLELNRDLYERDIKSIKRFFKSKYKIKI